MSTAIQNEIWGAPIPMAEKIVMLKMADCANDEGAGVWLSVSNIAKQCGCSERHVQHVIAKYVESGVLVVDAKPYTWEHRGKKMPTTLYRIIPKRVHDIHPEHDAPPNVVRKEGEQPAPKPSENLSISETNVSSIEKPGKRVRSLDELELDDELMDWWRRNCADVDADSMLEDLRLYCISKNKRYKDYRAALMTWGKREQKRIDEKRSRENQKLSPHTKMYAGFASIGLAEEPH